MSFEPLISALRASTERQVPGVRRGTVTSLAPLRVRLDGDTAPLGENPWVLGSQPAHVGQRVLSLWWEGNRAIIPTGAASSGSNTDGAWWRVGGLQICSLDVTVTDQACATAYGPLFIGQRLWTFPRAFAVPPVVTVGRFMWGSAASWGSVVTTTATAANLRIHDVSSRATGTATALSVTAVGVPAS